MARELQESLDTMTKAVTGLRKADASPLLKTALVTLADAISQIAAVLPAPHTVPIEPDEPVTKELP